MDSSHGWLALVKERELHLHEGVCAGVLRIECLLDPQLSRLALRVAELPTRDIKKSGCEQSSRCVCLAPACDRWSEYFARGRGDLLRRLQERTLFRSLRDHDRLYGATHGGHRLHGAHRPTRDDERRGERQRCEHRDRSIGDASARWRFARGARLSVCPSVSESGMRSHRMEDKSQFETWTVRKRRDRAGLNL